MTMHDCPDAAVRDLLPLRAAGRLDEASLAAVDAHVKGCADCTAELHLLRAAIRAYDVAPPDAAAMAAAIASRLPRAHVGRRARPFHGQPLWRIAAAITVMIAGTATMMIVRQPSVTTDPVAFGVDTGTAADTPAATLARAESTGSSVAALAGGGRATIGGSLADLSEAQLEALLASLERLDGYVSADPEVLESPIIPAAESAAGRRNP